MEPEVEAELARLLAGWNDQRNLVRFIAHFTYEQFLELFGREDDPALTNKDVCHAAEVAEEVLKGRPIRATIGARVSLYSGVMTLAQYEFATEWPDDELSAALHALGRFMQLTIPSTPEWLVERRKEEIVAMLLEYGTFGVNRVRAIEADHRWDDLVKEELRQEAKDAFYFIWSIGEFDTAREHVQLEIDMKHGRVG